MQCLLANKLILRTYRDRIACTAYPSVSMTLTKECVEWQSRFQELFVQALGGTATQVEEWLREGQARETAER